MGQELDIGTNAITEHGKGNDDIGNMVPRFEIEYSCKEKFKKNAGKRNEKNYKMIHNRNYLMDDYLL